MSDNYNQEQDKVEEEVVKSTEKSSKNTSDGEKKSDKNTSENDLFTQIDKFFQEYLVDKAPKIPENVKESLVIYLPVINMIIIIFTIFGLIFVPLVLFILRSVLGIPWFYFALGIGVITGPTLLITVATVFFQIKAQPGLQTKQFSSWNLLVCAQICAGVGSIISYQWWGLLFNILWLYFIYQVKKYYKV